MQPQLLSLACRLYNTSPDLLTPLSGGHYNAVYQYPLSQFSLPESVNESASEEKFGILRIGVEDCPPLQTLSMLHFMRYLSQAGASVVSPILSINGQLLERLEFDDQRYNLSAFVKASGVLAENIPPAEWTDDLFCAIGIALGRLHRISAAYRPSLPGFTRPHWFVSSQVKEAHRLLANKSDREADKLASLVNKLKNLPIAPDDYGLIHGDLHFANFLIQAGGKVSVIDFDDCVFGWFAMDVAMALFDVLVLYNASGEAESQEFAIRFMHNYLAGYRQEKELPGYWLQHIPDFLKLLELCIYATLIGHPDIMLPDTWVGRFMRGRAERIAHDLPYVDIDYSSL